MCVIMFLIVLCKLNFIGCVFVLLNIRICDLGCVLRCVLMVCVILWMGLLVRCWVLVKVVYVWIVVVFMRSVFVEVLIGMYFIWV